MKYSIDRMILINDHGGLAYPLQEYIKGEPSLLVLVVISLKIRDKNFK